MAYKDSNIFDRGTAEPQTEGTQTLQFTGETAELPHDSYIRDADFSQDGNDLVMNGPQGTLVVEDYFAGLEPPALIGPSGATLSPELVESFTTSGDQYAMNGTMSDVSPIGAIQEISGDATITRGDGTTESLSIGSPIYQGDIIETDGGSAVNVSFIDESSFAVSEESRLAIDEYVYDPASQGGVQNFSVLKGVFVYTSGFIGREDPDDVSIETPVGSIGIRGTIIAGDVNSGEITVVEGAIVLRSPLGEEMTLASQFETGKFGSNGISNLGQKSANEVIEKFSIVSKVAPNLFSSINDAAAEAPQAQQEANDKQPVQEQKSPDKAQDFDADGATDQDGDNEVDGTVEGAGEQTDASGEGEAPENVAEVGPEATVETGLENNGGMEALAVQSPESAEISDSGQKGHSKGHGKGKGKGKGHHGKHGKHHDSSIEDNFENQTDNQTASGTTLTLEALIGSTGIDKSARIGDDDYQGETHRLFSNPQGNTLTYTLDTDTEDLLDGVTMTSSGINLAHLITSWSFNNATGELDIDFNNDGTLAGWGQYDTSHFIGSGDINVIVTATDTALNTANTNYYINIHSDHIVSGDIDGNVSTDVDTFRNSADAFDILRSDVTVFADGQNNDIDIRADDVTVYGGGGDDIIDIRDTGGISPDNIIAHGDGNDDTFQLSNSVLSNLENGSIGDYTLVGGAGFDTIQMEGGANLNFSQLRADGNTFTNFESINSHTGFGNVVTLSFQDVIAITDGNNTLELDIGSLDTLNLNGFTSGGVSGGITVDNSGASSFDTYEFTNGSDTVTLLLSQDISGGSGTLNIA